MKGLHELKQAWTVLQQRWRTSSDLWRDKVRQGFEQDVWQEFEQIVPANQKEIENLSKIIAQARREVP